MTQLSDLYRSGGQSPWLDNLRRDWIRDGELARWVERGIRGVTSNPSIFEKAMTGQAVYDDQFRSLVAAGRSVEECYWEMVVTDISEALGVLRPVFDESDGATSTDTNPSMPSLARDTAGTLAAARHLHELIDAPNLYVKIPGTAEGLPGIFT